jgi:hypothetical protein
MAMSGALFIRDIKLALWLLSNPHPGATMFMSIVVNTPKGPNYGRWALVPGAA